MKNDCSIVKDLLPLYSEDMLSEETAQFVSEHLKGCENCEKEYESLKGGYTFEKTENTAPIKEIKKRIVRKRIASAVLSVFLVLTILFTGYSLLSARDYFEYDSSLMTVNDKVRIVPIESPNGKVVGSSFAVTLPDETDPNEDALGISLVMFDERVTGCSYYFTYEPETDTHSGTDGGWVCHIEAWTTLWDRLVKVVNEKLGRETSPQLLEIKGHPTYSIYYSSNNGQDETHIRGSNIYKGLALPRLTLNYYIVIAAACFIVSLTLLLIFRKKEKFGKIMTYVSFVPLSYIISSLAVMGFDATTYSLTRDLKLIIVLSIFILCIFVSVYRIVQVRKEIKEINKLN
ncbi:MAG: hypothetical protein E7515_03275 [Ruminococcaceae bacterium]|jgi:hypothetical protein|nr:hypothetical protein [Oscillospiraceae bacterium]